MEKTPLPVKIISGIIILFFLMLALVAVAGMCSAGSAFGAVFFFLMLVGCMFSIGLIASPIVSNAIAGKAARGTYWPGDKVELLPPDYSDIRSHIVKGDYYKAIDQLKEMIEEEPDNGIAVALLSDIYVDHTENYLKAIEVLSDFLNRPERSERDIPFIMKLTDVLLEINEDEKAIRLLEREQTLQYKEKDKVILKKRYDGINVAQASSLCSE